MNKKNTNLIFIASAITTMMAIVVLVFFFKIIENKNKHTSAVLSTLNEKILEKENAETLKEKIIEIESTYIKINDHLFNKESVDTFVSYMEDLGNSVGADISVKSIDSIKNQKNLMQVKVYSYGMFSSVMKSISLIENMPYKIDIIQVYLNKDLNKNTNDSEKVLPVLNNWSADITFNIKSSN